MDVRRLRIFPLRNKKWIELRQQTEKMKSECPRAKIIFLVFELKGIELHRQRAGDAARRNEPLVCAQSCRAA